MSVTVLVGAQWGDEGKGKIIDVLCENADIVARFQGGNNAGHTVIAKGQKLALHLIPSGVHNDKTICMIGNGVVVNPVQIVGEIDGLIEKGIDLTQRFQISSRAHLVFNYHCEMDALNESKRTNKIGTTKKGIGPTYADKITRSGIRAGDILKEETFKEKFRKNLEKYNKIFAENGVDTLDFETEYAEVKVACDRIRHMITDTVVTINEAIKEDKEILFEGAQGVWLDVDYGTYPYVTSSSTSAGGACTGGGVGPRAIDRVIGVVKAYTTRVGEGPFPAELHCELGERLRDIGKEYGVTTGRNRRCGWFDAVATSYAAMFNGMTDVAITKLDVLDHFDEIKICTAYEIDGEVTKYMPVDLEDFANAKPIYETHPGWKCDTTKAKSWDDLPENAQKYLTRLGEVIDTKISIISVGPDRDETFFV